MIRRHLSDARKEVKSVHRALVITGLMSHTDDSVVCWLSAMTLMTYADTAVNYNAPVIFTTAKSPNCKRVYLPSRLSDYFKSKIIVK